MLRGGPVTSAAPPGLPGLDPGVAREIVDAAHQICPYSKATRGNIDVKLSAKV